MLRRLCAWVLILAPLPSFAAASKEIQELQRDIATLQELMKSLQKAQDQIQQTQNEKFAALQVLVQQAISAGNNADKSLAVIQNALQQNMKDQEGKILPPVVQLSSRMDSMSNDVRAVQQAVSDLTSMVGKMQSQLGDINNALKVIQAPPAAPPPQAGGVAATSPPPMSAVDMFSQADRDRLAGNNDLALTGFENYLKFFGDSDQAASAQFYIGYIHYSQKDYEGAARDFESVVERFPNDNVRAPQALYQKGLSLLKLSRKTEAAQGFRDVVTQYPKSSYVQSACEQLQALGYNCPSGKTPAKTPAKSPAKSSKKGK